MEPIDEWVISEPWLKIDTTKPPKGYHWDPYRRAWRRNLTEAEVQNLWPYAKPKTKESPVADIPDYDYLEDALNQVAPKPSKEELHSAPVRMLGPEDTATKGPSRHERQVPAYAAMYGGSEEHYAKKLGEHLGQPLAADNVHLPQHYARYKIEPIRFSIENDLDGFQFNIIKYVCRHPFKNGREDLRKARRYLEMYEKFVYDKDPDWWR